jgi:cytidine deaminase
VVTISSGHSDPCSSLHRQEGHETMNEFRKARTSIIMTNKNKGTKRGTVTNIVTSAAGPMHT